MKNRLPDLHEPTHKRRFKIFDPDKLHAIARRSVGMEHDQQIDFIIDELAREYPGHIEKKKEWIFSCAGGAVGVMTIVHGSLSEYIVIFGSAIGTEGFSGRYRIGVHDYVLSGEMWTYTGDNVGVRVIHKPGERADLRPDQVKGFRFPEACWLLEYGHGPVPTALPFALADSIFSTLDRETIWKSLYLYGRLVVKELLQGKI